MVSARPAARREIDHAVAVLTLSPIFGGGAAAQLTGQDKQSREPQHPWRGGLPLSSLLQPIQHEV